MTLTWNIQVAWDGTYKTLPLCTSVLDNFNRADGAMGANWTWISNAVIDTNTVVIENPAAGPAYAFWATDTGVNCAAFFTLVTRPANLEGVDLLVRQEAIWGDGFTLAVIRNDATGDTMLLYDNTGEGILLGSFVIDLQSGDKFGLVANGTAITAYYMATGTSTWEAKITGTSSNHLHGGKIGFYLDDGSAAVIDDFGGGTYSNPNEATRATGLTVSRGRDNLIKPGGNGFEHMQVGEAVVTLDNEDRRFDPWYTSSPLYPNVAPGKFAKIQVTDTVSGLTYDVFRGTVDDIQSIGKNRVRLVMKDGIRWLRDRRINLGWYTFRIGPAISGVLTNAQWPTSHWASLPAGWSLLGDTLSHWWGRNQSAIDAINDLEDAEFGVFFQDAAGQAKFYDRDYDYGAATAITEEEILTDIVIPQPWEVLRNRAKIYAYPKKLDVLNTTLWQLQDKPYIAGNGGTFVVEATFRYSIWAVCGSAIGWDKTIWTNADGTGTDISADVTIAWTAIGDRSTLTLTNTNALGGYITLLRGVGDAIYPPYTASFVYEDAASEAAFGYRDFVLDNYWMESSDKAKNYANWIVTKLADPLAYPTIQIENRSALQFGLDLQRLVNLQIASRDIDENLKIGKITHTWLSENGQSVRTTFKLEPYLDPAEGYWILGTSQLGTTTILGF